MAVELVVRIGASGRTSCICGDFGVCVFCTRVPLDVDRENPKGKSSWQINVCT